MKRTKRLSPTALQSTAAGRKKLTLVNTPTGRSIATAVPDAHSNENLWAYAARLEARIAQLEAAALKPKTFMQRVMGD